MDIIQDMSGEFISLPNGEMLLLLLELEIPVIELGRKRGALASRYRRMDVRADADERRSGKRRERRCIFMAYQKLDQQVGRQLVRSTCSKSLSGVADRKPKFKSCSPFDLGTVSSYVKGSTILHVGNSNVNLY